jgi:putative PEP-CTERM system TPR-repeat lipoprotein
LARRLLFGFAINHMNPMLRVVLLLTLGSVACTRSPQDKAARFLRSGKENMRRSDYARAALEFRNAVQLMPKDPEPVYELGLAYLAEGNLDQAMAALFRVTQLAPNHVGAHVKIAELMVRSGETSIVREGQKRMRELLTSTPGNPEALNALALLELELGELQDAEGHLREALQRLPNNLSSTREFALLYLDRKDPNAAEEVLKKALAAAPESAEATMSLAEFYLFLGRFPEAEATFQSVLRISANNVSALLGLAAVERRLGKQDEAEHAYRKLSESPDKRYRHLHAAYLFAQGRREQALREFEKLAKDSPDDGASRNRLVAAFLVTSRVAAAENVLAAALKAHPNDADALLQQSQILLRSGRIQEAETDLNRVLHFNPNSAEAHYVLAQVYAERNQPHRQNEELSDALRYNAAFLPARAGLAELLTLSGSPNAALEVLNSAPNNQKERLILVLERNLANYASGDKVAFREGAAHALRIARTPDTLLQGAVAKLTERDYVGARALSDEALKQNPQDIRALRAKAYSYTAQNQQTEAKRFLTEYAAHSKFAGVALFVGEWLWSQGDHAQARTVFTRARELDVQSLPANLALARVDLAEERITDARATLAQMLATDPNYFPGHVVLAAVETKAGNFGTAIEHYRKALEFWPHNPEVLNNLAYLLADKSGQPDDALTYAQQAVELDPDNPDVAGTLGWVFYRKGLYREAQHNLQRAVALDRTSTQPNAVIRKYHLAMTYFSLGDRNKAMEVLGQALQQNPNLPEAAVVRSTLR